MKKNDGEHKKWREMIKEEKWTWRKLKKKQ